MHKKFDEPYNKYPAPTKIPAGALEFDISSLGEIKIVRLSLKDAVCLVEWEDGCRLYVFIHATKPEGWYYFDGLKSDLKPEII